MQIMFWGDDKNMPGERYIMKYNIQLKIVIYPILQSVESWVYGHQIATDSLQETSHQASCLLSFAAVVTQCRLFFLHQTTLITKLQKLNDFIFTV